MPKALLNEIGNLLQPLGLVWLALMLWAALAAKRRHYRTAIPAALLALVLWVCGASRLAEALTARLEAHAPPVSWNDLPPADLVVMLGGILNASPSDVFGFELASSADRALTAAEISRRRPPKVLLLLGSLEKGTEFTEGALVKEWFTRWNLIPAATKVLTAPACRNTREEAAATVKIAQDHGCKTIMLVTSAFHMKRAVAVFKQSGIEAIPVACDFRAPSGKGAAGKTFRWVPSAAILHLLSAAIHEHVSWLYYRWNGWIAD